MILRSENDYQQRVIASTIPWDPELKLARAMFEPKGMEQTDSGEVILYPTTDEEFEQMLQEFDRLQ